MKKLDLSRYVPLGIDARSEWQGYIAGLAVAVANAPARVQRCADLVTGSCMEGGVAMFLNALMEEKLGKTGV